MDEIATKQRSSATRRCYECKMRRQETRFADNGIRLALHCNQRRLNNNNSQTHKQRMTPLSNPKIWRLVLSCFTFCTLLAVASLQFAVCDLTAAQTGATSAQKPLSPFQQTKSLVNIDNIISAIELQHLNSAGSRKQTTTAAAKLNAGGSTNGKFDSPLSTPRLDGRSSTSTAAQLAAKLAHSAASSSPADVLHGRAMQGIVLAHELSSMRSSAAQSTQTPSSLDRSPTARLISSVASYIASKPLPAGAATANFTLLSTALNKLGAKTMASASDALRDESPLRKTSRALTSSVLAAAASNSAPMTTASVAPKANRATATTLTADNTQQQLSFRSTASNKRRVGFLASLGDRALHAAMIKPSLSYQDFVSEPSSSNGHASTLANTPLTSSSSSSSSPAATTSGARRVAKLSAPASAAGSGLSATALSHIRNNSLFSPTNVFQESLRNLFTLTQLPLLTSNSQQLPLYATLANAQLGAPLKSLLSSSAFAGKKKQPASSSTTAAPLASDSTSTSDLNFAESSPQSSSSASTSAATSTSPATQQSAITPLPAALTLSEQKRKLAAEEVLRFAYILTKRLSGKNDPLKALATSGPSLNAMPPNKTFSQRSKNPIASPNRQFLYYLRQLRHLLLGGPRLQLPVKKNQIRPRGVMWDMATDPSLAVTMFHMLESASVALPLGFLLMPFVQMMKNPLNGIGLSRGFNSILPTKASHRSVDYEELAKRLDVIDRVFSKALRQTHRESSGFQFG